ncbi:hypothetical protein HO173_008383 [Letharia columbiana]|uniref:Uncharacterized protein n=1 Tax=Letharia columbiana TaxID=112416 RepID=A0A8H6FRQ7_9LECA|nr:uncharacterized protein HO173_008383 [Letharia columbiana]KAF6233451.1 hypothetical protein HO173_008383 [Letharia columbiana]
MKLSREQQASTDEPDSRDRRIGQKETTIQDLTTANAELRKTQETFIGSLSQRETRIQDLTEDLASSCGAQEVREFKGIEEGKIVLVRAQRCCSERRGLVIVEQSDHTRISVARGVLIGAGLRCGGGNGFCVLKTDRMEHGWRSVSTTRLESMSLRSGIKGLDDWVL